MPINREFIYEEHQDSGFWGLTPAWMQIADPSTGQGCAHDMLEHFPSVGNPFEDELLAIGALYVLRYEAGRVNRTPAEYIAAILQEVLGYMLRRGDVPLPRKTRALNREDLPESEMQDAVELAFDMLSRTWKEHLQGDDADEPRSLDDVQAVKQRVTEWLLRGYARAYRRYARSDVWGVATRLFPAVTKEVDSLLQSQALQPGARVRISARLGGDYGVNIRVMQPQTSRWVPAHQLH